MARLTLVDTSVAVPLLVADHAAHTALADATDGRRLGLAGHAAFESFSVLTRLPPPARRQAPAVRRLLTENFPDSRFLGAVEGARLLTELDELGITGGSTYDALVAAAAVQYDATLLSRDRRAVDTYRALDVRLELLD